MLFMVSSRICGPDLDDLQRQAVSQRHLCVPGRGPASSALKISSLSDCNGALHQIPSATGPLSRGNFDARLSVVGARSAPSFSHRWSKMQRSNTSLDSGPLQCGSSRACSHVRRQGF